MHENHSWPIALNSEATVIDQYVYIAHAVCLYIYIYTPFEVDLVRSVKKRARKPGDPAEEVSTVSTGMDFTAAALPMGS